MCLCYSGHACTQLESLIEKNYYLHKSARDAYRSYLQSYASHSLKMVFNVETLDLLRVAKGFGFSTPPNVPLSILSFTPSSRRVQHCMVWGVDIALGTNFAMLSVYLVLLHALTADLQRCSQQQGREGSQQDERRGRRVAE